MIVPVSMGFFGGHVENVSNGQGVFVRDDGQRFSWEGASPFYNFPDVKSWPAYCNRAIVPSAPHNVPGARREVWSYGPNPCLYAGKYRFPVPLFSAVDVGWLFPIAPGEVLWIGAPAGAAMTDLGSSSVRPAFNVTVSGDAPVFSPKWVCSSLDGRCVVVYDGRYFYDVAVSVEKKTGVINERTSSKVRYDVTLAYTRYNDSIGRVVDIEKNTVHNIDVVNLSGTVFLGEVSFPVGPAGHTESTTLYQTVFHVRYEINGKPLAEYKDVVHDMGGNTNIGWAYIEPYLQEHGIYDRTMSAWLLGDEVFIDVVYPRTSIVGHTFTLHAGNVFSLQCHDVPEGGTKHINYAGFGDALAASPYIGSAVIKSSPDAVYLRAIAPGKIYLSDNEGDESFFFV
ncbi:hypothetical protein DLM_2077 [Aquitalea magnusonii]|uniref:Uncharacterized protein n=1 Tax=Aquitalea magnusonii TaxID=332411 RepID=A0A3G9GHX4_9NEIS|nr:hypothetical protein [Aquitalea magnusonii]BBF85692.1 hypothetical protein DLM_2077 [Aquitalea magnusonii]